MTADLAPVYPKSPIFDASDIFCAYRAAEIHYRGNSLRAIFNRLFGKSFEQEGDKVLSHYAHRLHAILTRGSLVRLYPKDNKPPKDIVFGRREGEYFLLDADSLKICRNPQSGWMITKETIEDLLDFKSLCYLGRYQGTRDRRQDISYENDYHRMEGQEIAPSQKPVTNR